MLKLNYFIHSILNSKHRILITIAIYLLIYLTIRNTSITYCMTENPDMPTVAEAKSTSTEMPDLIKDIQAFAGSRASALETVVQEKDSIIAEKEQLLEKKEIYISLLNQHIRTQENYFDEAMEMVYEHEPDAIIGVPGSIPTFADAEAKYNLDHREPTGETDEGSNSDYYYTDQREPYFTHYGSDSDNDLGFFNDRNNDDYALPIDWGRYDNDDES